MGRKRTRAWKYVYFCVAGLISFSLANCAYLEKTKIEREGEAARHYLLRSKILLAQGDYEGALRENQTVLFLSVHQPPEDEALFNMGLIYVYPGNPRKDYGKSLGFFKKLAADYPQTPWGEQGKIWMGVLKEIDQLNEKIEKVTEALKEKEKLSKKIEKVNEPLETSKHLTSTEERNEARDLFLRVQNLLAQGDYEGALRENQRVLSRSGNKPPGDKALFNIGLIYAHAGNPKKDYAKALGSFRRIIKDYPKSPWVEEAKIWVGMLQENEKLNRGIEELTLVIEKSKQVDIEIEEKKREKTK